MPRIFAPGAQATLIVREHQDLLFISQNGMVQRTGVRGISQQGRPAQGVRVMNLREDDMVSAVALVMEDEADTAAVVDGAPDGLEPIAELTAPDDPETAGLAEPDESDISGDVAPSENDAEDERPDGE